MSCSSLYLLVVSGGIASFRAGGRRRGKRTGTAPWWLEADCFDECDQQDGDVRYIAFPEYRRILRMFIMLSVKRGL